AAAGFNLGADYHTTGYWVYRRLFGVLLDAVLPNRGPETGVGGGFLDRQRIPGSDRTLLHIVPSFTTRRWGQRNDFYDRQPTLSNVSLSVSLGHPITSAIALRGSGSVTLYADGDRTRFDIFRISGPEIVALT
ncbi:MAG: hypothetical protein ABJA74_16580, partial [Lapillicoccus sp.]